jgi:altronate hydrolase
MNVELVNSAPRGLVPLNQVAIRLHPDDDVAVVREYVGVGTTLEVEGTQIPVQSFISSGHKVALRALADGQAVRRYGQIIGFATQAIRPGDHVHTHNLAVRDFDRNYAYGVDVVPVDRIAPEQQRTFMGYRRPDGRVGTRNCIGVISTVNCSAHTVREIARAFTPERLAHYPNVDGVVAFAHLSGCGSALGGADYVLLQRTLAGMARHPNIGAYIIVGLGCETNQVSDLIANYGLNHGDFEPYHITIQDAGGVRKTIEAGITAIEELLPLVNATQRTPQPVSAINLALQCGGSDGWSGVTANPALGLVVDELVRQTPEIYGAEHLLTRRAINRAVGEKLVAKVRWWEQHTTQHGIVIDNNPSVGNKAGGLTTIYEKSLGAVAKGGHTPLMAVYDYAEPISKRGFVYMDTPGYDSVSATGQVAGGSNLIMFTTGRGSCFGFKPAPSIKIATNSAMYHHMVDDMDVNAGAVLEGSATLEQVAAEMFELMIAVASGQPSKSEAQGIGEAEFNPWTLGGTL